MAFGNNRQQQQRTNTTTKVVQLYNPTGEDAGTLRLGYWNQYATMKINPMLEPSDQKDGKIYNYEREVSVLLDLPTVLSIQSELKKMIKAKAAKTAVPSSTVFYMGGAIKFGPDGGTEYPDIKDWYVALFEVDDKHIAKNSLFFQMTKDRDHVIHRGWNEEDGTSEKKLAINASFEAFRAFIDLAARELILGGAHGSTHSMNFTMSRISQRLETMKNFMEMSAVAGNSGGRSYGGGNNGGNNGGGNYSGRRRSAGGDNNAGGAANGGRRRGAAPAEADTSLDDLESEILAGMDEE